MLILQYTPQFASGKLVPKDASHLTEVQLSRQDRCMHRATLGLLLLGGIRSVAAALNIGPLLVKGLRHS